MICLFGGNVASMARVAHGRTRMIVFPLIPGRSFTISSVKHRSMTSLQLDPCRRDCASGQGEPSPPPRRYGTSPSATGHDRCTGVDFSVVPEADSFLSPCYPRSAKPTYGLAEICDAAVLCVRFIVTSAPHCASGSWLAIHGNQGRRAHQNIEGVGDYRKVNPLGYVPALVLDDGTLLTEGPAIVQYIADQVPAKRLAPPNGTIDRAKLQGWLNFFSSEMHKGAFGPLFYKGISEESKMVFRRRLAARLVHLDGYLADHVYLVGDHFTIADAHSFTVTNWAPRIDVDLLPYPSIWRIAGESPLVQLFKLQCKQRARSPHPISNPPRDTRGRFVRRPSIGVRTSLNSGREFNRPRKRC